MDKTSMTLLGLGALLIALGVVSMLIKNNTIVGVRTKWSMYNDNTWKKSNKVGGIAMIISGVLAAVFALVIKGNPALIATFVVVIIAAVVSVIASKKYYDEEIKNENSDNQ